MTKLLVADIHMTTDPRDRHRWELLPWLCDQAKAHGVNEVLILGDLTGAKDRHPASLVNRFADGIERLNRQAKVIILRGNHDHVDPLIPFFSFTKHFPNVLYISDHGVDTSLPNSAVDIFLGNSAAPEKDWAKLDPKLFKKARYIFCHQTFRNAQYENGTRATDGLAPTYFRERGFTGQAYSGDIHLPQRFVKAGIEYVGAPYRIDFGDHYTPRVLLLHDDGSTENLHFPCPSKRLIEVNADGEIFSADRMEEIRPGDQVKVRVTLARESFSLWPKLRKEIRGWAEKGEWELYGPELLTLRTDQSTTPLAVEPRRIAPAELVRTYGKANALDADMLGVGLEILGASNDG